MTGSHSLIEDSKGEITTVKFYGLMHPVNPETANKIVPKGTKVTIFEPFYKFGERNGTKSIRVDNPNDVILELP
jgi:hypothetical protein